MDLVRVGVIGCGRMVTHHLGTLQGKDPHTAPELRPFAEQTVPRGFCDMDRAKAEDYLETYGGDYATDDPAKLFADPDIDAVVIATWHDTHAPFSLQALDAGKHVLIEKPMCMTEKQCDDIVEAVARTGLKYMPAFRARFAKGSQAVKREIPQPDNIIACARARGIWGEHVWAQDPVKGGGQILSQGCHIVDLMFYLAGAEPESIYATGGVFHHTKPEPMDTINAAIRYRNGSVGAFMGGDGGLANMLTHHTLPNNCPFFVMALAKGRSGVAFDHGEAACFESCVDDWKPPCECTVTADSAPPKEALNGLADILPALSRAIVEDTEPPATAVDGARTTRFILKCFESARTGEVVRF